MLPTKVTVSTSGTASSPIVVDYLAQTFALGIQVGVSTPSTGTMVVQYTLDDPFGVYTNGYGSDATWFSTAFSGITTSTAGIFLTPCRAVRLNSTLFSAGATATLTVVQASHA